jgi:hypothetical protein
LKEKLKKDQGRTFSTILGVMENKTDKRKLKTKEEKNTENRSVTKKKGKEIILKYP